MPFSTAKGNSQPFIDSLFVATSGISTTGLTVVDIGTYYSLAGQLILLVIFQIGGIGYMSIVVFIISFFKVKSSMRMNQTAIDSIAGASQLKLGRFFRFIVLFTFISETASGLALTLVWMNQFGILRALYYGFFHSISAFCTAGFSPFSDSLMQFRTNISVNIIIIITSLLGGIGFIVVYDMVNYIKNRMILKKRTRLSIHTKIILLSTVAIIILATVVFIISEKWPNSMDTLDRIQSSLFQAVSASTTDGFNTIDIGKMNERSLIMIMMQMFTGASPGSTAGGIKISTLSIILLYLIHQIRTRKETINLFRRQLPIGTIHKAFSVFVWFIIIIVIDLGILCTTEKSSSFQLAFEIISAMGNTGLSMGITQGLSDLARIMFIITMFIGRVGPLIFALALMGKIKSLPYEFPREDILVT
ncbi:MAG: hypothetical protein JXL67_06570 [Calditrichaeota bacterium]|nr:hypothetical protein [Calditrichota bacterium]